MTDQEKKLQRAQLQVELEDAQQELAYLQEKALRVAEQIGKIAQKVRENAELQPSKSDFSMEADGERRLGPQSQAVFDYAATVRLIEELKVARQNVLNLQERKMRLANAAGWTIAS